MTNGEKEIWRQVYAAFFVVDGNARRSMLKADAAVAGLSNDPTLLAADAIVDPIPEPATEPATDPVAKKAKSPPVKGGQ